MDASKNHSLKPTSAPKTASFQDEVNTFGMPTVPLEFDPFIPAQFNKLVMMPLFDKLEESNSKERDLAKQVKTQEA